VAAPIAEARFAEQQFVSGTDVFVPALELPRSELQRTYLTLYTKSKKRGSDPGRNILLKGVATGKGRVRAATAADLQRSIRVLRNAGAPNPQLQAIAACESGGDPGAIGGGGLYRGKYQFTYETWQSVGGTGDPAAAPEAEQDARAAALLARDGAGHWPVCGG
jgi:Transglycosylase-like domain